MRTVQAFLATPRGRLVVAGLAAVLLVAGVVGVVVHDGGDDTQVQADRTTRPDEPVQGSDDLPDDLLGLTTSSTTGPTGSPVATAVPSVSTTAKPTTTTVANPVACPGTAPLVDAKALWVVDVADGRVRQVIEGDTSIYAWSPDGRYLAFVSGSGRALHVYDRTTATYQAVYSTHQVWGGPAWSSDSLSLVFGARTTTSSDDLYRVPVGGGTAQLVHDVDSLLGDVEVRPDGSIVFTDGGTLAVVDADGGNRRNLVVSNPNRSVSTFALSPDGARVAFTDRNDLVVMVVGDAKQTKVGTTQPSGFAVEWSADGTRVLFARVRPEGAVSAVASRADGSDIREFAVTGSGATLSPNGNEAAWGIGVGSASPKVTVTDLASGGDRVFAESMWQPAWRPAQGGMAAMATVANQSRPALCLLPASGGAATARRLAQFSPRAAPYSALKWSPSGATLAFASLI